MSFPSISHVVLIGVIATAVMDMWLLILSRLGVPTTDWRLVGRWVGQMAQGRFAHAPIAKVAPVRGEHPLGWLIHYGVGPAMGSGFAGSNTTAPVRGCVRTLANHAVFGAGLYVAAAGIAYL
ncbi:DUF2938 family protein [Variovorax sp. YR216]|uniref:DUF2938 family protein n=1 Tax=Variovorax sp. YR216 TaxID=1882828 RepID=UPI0008960C06|nr:DUF2938 family protein [Variovorax sp. YR216]SEB13605.1 Protein of unknown function [Variovorax sp. YR216]